MNKTKTLNGSPKKISTLVQFWNDCQTIPHESVLTPPPHTKAGRPKLPNKKQTKTIRLYPADIAAITAQHDTIQKWINKVVKQISEIK
jgi:hypothetical protein